MEKDRILRPDQALLVWDVAWRRDQLETRLEDMQVGDVGPDDEATIGLQGRINKLSAFVNNYSFKEGGPFEAPLCDPKRNKKERTNVVSTAQDNTIDLADRAIAYLLEHDGMAVPEEEGENPVKTMQEAIGSTSGSWETLRRLNKRLQFLFFARDPNNKEEFKSVSLNVSLADDLIESGRLSEETLDRLTKYRNNQRRKRARNEKKLREKIEMEKPEAAEEAVEEEIVPSPETALQIHQAKERRELALRAGMTEGERAADTRRRALEKLSGGLAGEMRGKSQQSRNTERLAREKALRLEINVEAGGERLKVTTTGRFFAELDEDVRVLAALSQLTAGRYKSIFNSEEKQWKFVLDRVNVARTKSQKIGVKHLKGLVREALERGEISVNGSELPSVTGAGLGRMRDAKIKPHVPGVMLRT